MNCLSIVYPLLFHEGTKKAVLQATLLYTKRKSGVMYYLLLQNVIHNEHSAKYRHIATL